MKTNEEYRQAYLDGKQERDHNGDRLWKITETLTWQFSDPQDNLKMWECHTAEGPMILAARDGITPRLQVQDGSPERNDACAETFVFGMEWSDFCYLWYLVATTWKD